MKFRSVRQQGQTCCAGNARGSTDAFDLLGAFRGFKRRLEDCAVGNSFYQLKFSPQRFLDSACWSGRSGTCFRRVRVVGPLDISVVAYDVGNVVFLRESHQRIDVQCPFYRSWKPSYRGQYRPRGAPYIWSRDVAHFLPRRSGQSTAEPISRDVERDLGREVKAEKATVNASLRACLARAEATSVVVESRDCGVEYFLALRNTDLFQWIVATLIRRSCQTAALPVVIAKASVPRPLLLSPRSSRVLVRSFSALRVRLPSPRMPRSALASAALTIESRVICAAIFFASDL